MSSYVLIHGSWHGAWCWDGVKARLEAEGHTVSALDLPGHGRDMTPIGQISLQSYVERIGQALNAAAEPVILVGHSMGGVPVSQAAELWPEKIDSLVYLTAILPLHGQSLLDIALQDSASFLLPNLVVDEANGLTTVKPEAVRQAFYADCSDDDVARAISMLRPDPLVPVATPVQLSQAKFGRLPRVYIECLQDQAISLAAQRNMLAATPCQRVFSLDSGHSPFLSMPDALAKSLLAVARQPVP